MGRTLWQLFVGAPGPEVRACNCSGTQTPPKSTSLPRATRRHTQMLAPVPSMVTRLQKGLPWLSVSALCEWRAAPCKTTSCCRCKRSLRLGRTLSSRRTPPAQSCTSNVYRSVAPLIKARCTCISERSSQKLPIPYFRRWRRRSVGRSWARCFAPSASCRCCCTPAGP